jgi:hypothetical protein
MTVSKLVKTFLFVRYNAAWRKRRDLGGRSTTGYQQPLHHIVWNDFDPLTQILMIDATMKLKYLSKSVQNCLGFMKNQICRESTAFLALKNT